MVWPQRKLGGNRKWVATGWRGLRKFLSWTSALTWPLADLVRKMVGERS